MEFMDLSLLIAARTGDLKKIKELAEDVERKIYDQTTPEGNTVLHMAAGFGHQDLVEEIVKQYPSHVQKSNLKGETPVHIAAKAGKGEVVKTFIYSVKNFSKIHIARTRDKYGNTPLHGAVRNRHDAVVKELACEDKESLLLINDAGESPLSIAIEMRFTEIAKSIISLNASCVELIGHNGQTPLHYAVLRHDSDTMAAILRWKRDLVRVQDERNRTPLHYAAALGHQTIVQKLLQMDPLVAYIRDNNQQIPLHLAAENGQLSLIKTLLERCPDTIEIVDKKQQNILHLASKNGNFYVVSHILKLPEMEYLVNSPDVDGNTPLHLASNNYYIDVVDVLSKNPKVEIMATNNSNMTALEIVKLPDDRGMELQKHLTLKVLKNVYKKKGFDPEDILENKQWDDVDKGNYDGVKGRALEVEKARKTGSERSREMAQMISVMSTLIATFTFTAAFTMPGGFKSDSKEDAGMATLIKISAFQAFVIFDALAMSSSITAAAIVFWSASIRDAELYMDILSFSIGLTWISLIAVILAFVTGLFAALQEKLWLAILVCGIGCATPFFLYIATIVLSFERNSKSRHKIVEDNPFFFIFRLVKMFVTNHIQNLFSC